MGRKGKNKGGGAAQTTDNAEASTQQVNVTPVDTVKVSELQKSVQQPQKPVEPAQPATDVKIAQVEVPPKPVESPKPTASTDSASGTETNEIAKDGTSKKKKKNKNQQPGENVPQAAQPPKPQPPKPQPSKPQPPKTQQPKAQPPTESKQNGEIISVEGEAALGDTGTAKKKRNKKKKAQHPVGDQQPAEGYGAPMVSPKPAEQNADGEATLKKKKNKKSKKREAANLENKEAGEAKAAEQPDLKKDESKVEIKPVAKAEEAKIDTVQTPAIVPTMKKEEEHKKNKNQEKQQAPLKVDEQKPVDSVKSIKPEKKVEQVQENKKQGNDQKRERKESESNKKNKNAEKKSEIKKEEKQEEKKIETVIKSESEKHGNQQPQQQTKDQSPKNEQKKLESPVQQPKPDSPKSQEKKQLPKTDAAENKKNEEPKVTTQDVEKKIEEETKTESTKPRFIKCAMFGPALPEDEKKPELQDEKKAEVKKVEEKNVEQKKVEEKKVEEKKLETVKGPEKTENVGKNEKQQQKKDKPESVPKAEKPKSESPKPQEKKQSPKPDVKETKKVEPTKAVPKKPIELPTVAKVSEVENTPKMIKCALFAPEVTSPLVQETIPSKVPEVTMLNVSDVKPVPLPEKKIAPEIPTVCPAAKPEAIQTIKPAPIIEAISTPLPEAKVEKPAEVIKSDEIKPVTPNKEMDKQLLNAALTELIDSVSKMNLSEPKTIPAAEVKSNTSEQKKNLQPQQPKQDANKRNKSKSPRPETKQEPKQDQKTKGKNNEKNKPVKADTDIPMDMSVISKSSIEDAVAADKTSQTSNNSKNEQRSDFVPSVDQQPKQSSAKSQGTNNKNQSDKKNDAVKKGEPLPELVRQAQNVTPTSNKRSKDEANMKQTEAIAELKTHELPEKTAQEKMDAVTVPVKLLDILDAKMTTPTESTQAKSPKAPQPNSAKKDEKKQDNSPKQKKPNEQQPKKQSKTPPPGKKPDGKQQQQEKNATGSKNELIPKEIKLEDNLKVESLSEVKPLPSNPPNVLLGSNSPKVEHEQKLATAATSAPLKPQGIKPVIPPKPVALGIKKSPSPPVSSKQENLPSPGTSNPKETTPPKQSEKSKKPEILPKPTNVPAPPSKKPPPPPADEDEEYIEYKISPRPVFLSTICQICKTALKQFTTCSLCQMVSYCSEQHMKDDLPVHKDLCSAIQDIAKKRGGHLYNNAKILNNEDFRSLRTHSMLLCEKDLKRQLQLFEREILLYPRICATNTCREWRPNLLVACPDCGQTSYCVHHPDHLPATHKIWCKSYSLFQKLVLRQKNSGRIEPSLPSKIYQTEYKLPATMDGAFKDLYKNNAILKDECSHAALSLVATAPLTALSAAQKCNIEIPDKFIIHLIGAELQFEADTLDKWEAFFLHLVPQLVELRIVFIGPELNSENLPLDVLSRIRMCRACRQSARAVKFDFQCGKLYHEYAKSSFFTKPDLVCFFNPGLYRPTGFNGLDTWPETIRATTTIGCPIVITSYTEYESPMDLARLEKESKRELKIIHAPAINPFASQRPDRNFISDEIVPMIFKNYFLFIVK